MNIKSFVVSLFAFVVVCNPIKATYLDDLYDRDIPFFGNITYHASLEECIAYGFIKSSARPNEYELSTKTFNGCPFTRTEVKLVANNVIKEINLTYHYNPNFPDKRGDLSNAIFNSMLQYACQAYGKMQYGDIHSNNGKIEKNGYRKSWSTSTLNIDLEFYDETVHSTPEVLRQWNGRDPNAMLWEGTYVKFIVRKK